MTRVVILIGCILLFIACIYPPYKLLLGTSTKSIVAETGYKFLFSLKSKWDTSQVVDWERLALEIVAIVALTVGGIMLVKIFSRRREN